jgi:hypothetical protein
MNETINSSIFMALLFVLRCLIPLGILFGVSYLLRRLGLVSEHSDEALLAGTEEESAMKPTTPEATGEDSAKKSPPKTKKKTDGKNKPATSKKKGHNQ